MPLGSPFCGRLPLGYCLGFLSSSAVALLVFCPLGLPLTFFSSFLLLSLPSGGFRLCRHLFCSVDVPSLHILPCSLLRLVASVPVLYSLVMVSVPVLLLLCLSAYASLPYFGVFFIAAFTSGLLVLLGQHTCGFSSYSPLLPRSDLSSFATESPFGTSQLLRLVPSPPSPDLLVGLCTLLPSFRCHSLSVSLPLLIWPSASFSSLPLPCAIFQEYEEPVYSYSTYPDRRYSSSTSQHFKMSPLFASSDGVSGYRYQSDGAHRTQPPRHCLSAR